MDIEALREVFREEAYELLTQAESSLLELVENPSDSEPINTVFRAMHTIKGSGGMCGYTKLSDFTHEVENLFDCMRKGKIAPDEGIIQLSLRAKDCIRNLIEGDDSLEQEDLRNKILLEIKSITGGMVCSDQSAHSCEIPKDSINLEAINSESYKIVFMPVPSILSHGVKIEPLLMEVSSLGEATVKCDISSIPDFDSLDPEECYFNWVIHLETSRDLMEIKDIFMFTEDYAEVVIRYKEGFLLNNTFFKSEEKGTVIEKKIPSVLNLLEEKTKKADKIIFDRRKADTTSIRVKNEKLDSLVNLVGELVTLQARFSQEANFARIPEFISLAENLEKLTEDLRDTTMSIRMVPISETFNSFNRLIYDLSNSLGKKIKLVTYGGETELDKNVIEALRDPLLHIIRNSCDHGIESPDIRLSKGKDETGIIELVAEHSGSNVVIKISDDGAGLDREKILARAIERGLLQPGEYDDRVIYSMIFEPGFSTAEIVTDISGRGVGMDVVKKNIEKLRGTISVESRENRGTMITLTIPLTLAIIDGFMVELAGSPYIFNLSHVRECLDFSDDVERDEKSQFMINLRGEIVPCIDLRGIFGCNDKEVAYPQIVISEIADEKYGFLVDKVIGKYQTVVKPLGRVSRNLNMIAGATILGDGTVALILDGQSIIKEMSGSANDYMSDYIRH